MDHKMNDPKKRKAANPNPTAKKAKKNDSKKGDDAVKYVIESIEEIGDWEVKKMGEATAADFAVRRKGTDLWIPFQGKSCSTGKGQFDTRGNYNNMVMCLVELEKDGINVWMGRWDEFPTTQVGDIRGKKYKDKYHKTYDAFKVLDKHNLNARLHSLDTDPAITKLQLVDLNVSTSDTQRMERLSAVLFAKILAGFGLAMQQPEYESTATDWFLKDVSYQDKTAGRMHRLQFEVGLCKSAGRLNGKRQHQPYRVGDNNFYIIFVHDKKYPDLEKLSIEQFHELCTTASLRGCYLFSEAELIASGHIATDNQKGNKTLLLPAPNPDGSFEPESKHSSGRTHNFQPNYFHKDCFQELIDRMIF